MEDRKLDAAESLALIGRMIENTRSRMVRNAGRPFLAWGYATAATLIAVWAAVSCTGDIRWNYLWFMLPLLGGALMYFTRPKATEGSVHTYVDRVLDLIWSVIGPATLLISTLAICFVVRFPVAFTVLLMIGLGTTINNLIIGFKPGVAGGIAGIVLASVSLVVTGNWHAGLFLAAFVLMTIIPGHILNYRYRHSRSDVRQAAGPRPGKATKDGAAEEDGSTEEDGAATENGTAEGGAATDNTAADGAATGSAPADRPLDAAENIALVGRMIDKLRASPAWDDLLVVLVADHGYPWPRSLSYNEPLRHRIPMIWTGGAVAGPRVVEEYASQIDICATILGQLEVAHDDFDYSKDIFAPTPPRKFAYYTFNDGFGVVDASGEAVWDATSGKAVSETSPALMDVGRTMLQTTYTDIGNR